MSIRIICISDTHGFHGKQTIPDGDILLHAGDMTSMGELDVVSDFNRYLGKLPHKHKIVIAGNHDFCFEDNPGEAQSRLTNAIYLQDEAVTIAGIKFYGSPWQPYFFDWAFQQKRGAAMRAKWDLIPTDTDFLITHGPPHGIGDGTAAGDQAGCRELLSVVDLIQPRFHLFGHIHESAGISTQNGTTFINASFCGFPDYTQFQQAYIVEYD